MQRSNLILILRKDQFLSIYNRLIGSINKIKDQLIEESAGKQKGKARKGSREINSNQRNRNSGHKFINMNQSLDAIKNCQIQNAEGSVIHSRGNKAEIQLNRDSEKSTDERSQNGLGREARILLKSSETLTKNYYEDIRSSSKRDDRKQFNLMKRSESPYRSRKSSLDIQKSKSKDLTSSHNKVFDDLLNRLDRLKETLEIDQTTKRLDEHFNQNRKQIISHPQEIGSTDRNTENNLRPFFRGHPSSSDRNSNINDCSRISMKYDIGTSDRNNTKRDLLELMNYNKNSYDQSGKPTIGISSPHYISRIRYESPSINMVANEKKLQSEELEYSPSKKESYGSQIDNFLTSETNLLKSVNPQRHENSRNNQMNSRIGPGSRLHHYPEEIIEEESSYYGGEKIPNNNSRRFRENEGSNKFHLRPQFNQINPIIPQTTNLTQIPQMSINQIGESRESSKPRNSIVGNLPTNSPYFAKLLSTYSVKYSAELNNFERREKQFEKLKTYLDRQQDDLSKERSRRTISRSGSRFNEERDKKKMKNIKDKVDNIGKKFNQYNFTFKEEESNREFDHGKNNNHRMHEAQNHINHSSKYHNSIGTTNSQKSKKSEASLSPNNKHHKISTQSIVSNRIHGNSRNHNEMVFEEDSSNKFFYSSSTDKYTNNHNDNHNSIKSPVFLEIPLHDDGEASSNNPNSRFQSSANKNNHSLKDAYDRFIQHKKLHSKEKKVDQRTRKPHNISFKNSALAPQSNNINQREMEKEGNKRSHSIYHNPKSISQNQRRSNPAGSSSNTQKNKSKGKKRHELIKRYDHDRRLMR